MTPSSPTDASALRATTRVVANDAVLASPLGGEVVLLEPDAGVYYSLNEVGALLWDRMQAPTTVPELCEAVVAEFEVDRAVCEPDVRRLVGDLVRHDLVRLLDPVDPDPDRPRS